MIGGIFNIEYGWSDVVIDNVFVVVINESIINFFNCFLIFGSSV